MKQFYSLILIFTFFAGFSQEKQIGEVLYEVNMMMPEDTNQGTSSAETRNKVRMLMKTSRPERFRLIFNENESRYEIIKRMNSDIDSKINLSKILGGSNKIFYHNIKTSIQYYNENFSGEDWSVFYENYNYKLTKEKKTVLGFLCYKATFGKGRYAWYTPEIPVNFGPGKYNGLPGLVLEAMHKGLLITAKKINLDSNNIQLEVPVVGKKISEEDYIDLKSKNAGF